MQKRFLVPALVATTALALSGCAGNDSAPVDSNIDSNVQINHKAAALLPADVAKSGVLSVAINPTNPPNEDKGSDGTLIGWEVELMNAIGAKLGVSVKYHDSKSDDILDAVDKGGADLAISSITDTKDREKQVDFIDYFTAGIQWASPKGKKVDPGKACGLTVAVESKSAAATDNVPARSKKCGKKAIKILPFDTVNDAADAVVSGKADAMAADSVHTGHAVEGSDGTLQLAGGIIDPAPYGIAIKKDSADMKEAVMASLTLLMANGAYQKILKTSGVDAGAVDVLRINGAG